jgi:hypothetical protein
VTVEGTTSPSNVKASGSFTITVSNSCSGATIKTSALTDQTYTISDPQVPYTHPGFTPSVAGCGLTYSISTSSVGLSSIVSYSSGQFLIGPSTDNLLVGTYTI